MNSLTEIKITEELGVKISQAVIKQCRKILIENYESAGISGLCEEGRWEAALGSLATVDLSSIVKKTIQNCIPNDVN